MRRTRRVTTQIFGTESERGARYGLSYEYLIRLRKSQKEREDEAPMSKQMKQEREEKEKEFILGNNVNQRSSTSIQALYRSEFVRQRRNISSRNRIVTSDAMNVMLGSTYLSQRSRLAYKDQLVELRKDKANLNEESEFRNPLSRPLRGLDEDENDRDYMEGKEIRRELRNSADYEEMFHKYICEREVADLEVFRSLEAGVWEIGC